MMKLRRYHYIFVGLLACLLVLFISDSVQAFQIATDEMDKVKAVSSHLITVTQGMAEASILPVGISSSVKILRHVVLNNV